MTSSGWAITKMPLVRQRHFFVLKNLPPILPPLELVRKVFLIAFLIREIMGVFVSLAVASFFHEGSWGVAEVEWDG